MFNNGYNPFASVLSTPMTIVGLLLVPTGHSEYKEVLARPYTISVGGDVVQELSERITERQTNKLDSGMMSGLVNGLIQPSAIGQATAINHTWVSDQRFIFRLIAEYVTSGDCIRRSYLIGYTNYNGLSHANSIDPEMMFHVNSVIETTIHTRQIGNQFETTERLYRMYNVCNNTSSDLMIFTQRPTDIFAARDTHDALAYSGTDRTTNMSYTISPHDGRSLCSNAKNNIPVEWAVSVLNTGMTNARQQDMFMLSHEEIQQVDPTYIEPSLGDNLFMKSLSRLSGHQGMRSSFRMAELLRIDPTTDTDKTTVINLNSRYMDLSYLNTPTDCEYWDGQDGTTVHAYSILQASVAMALQYGFERLSFTACNHNSQWDPGCHVVVTDAKNCMTLSQTEFASVLDMFRHKFALEVFDNESMQNQITVVMEVHVDLFGATKIGISYGGEYQRWYSLPTFASANTSPVITYDYNAVHDLAYSATNCGLALAQNVKSHDNNYFGAYQQFM